MYFKVGDRVTVVSDTGRNSIGSHTLPYGSTHTVVSVIGYEGTELRAYRVEGDIYILHADVVAGQGVASTPPSIHSILNKITSEEAVILHRFFYTYYRSNDSDI